MQSCDALIMQLGSSKKSQVCRREIFNPDLGHSSLPARNNILMIMLDAIEDLNVKDMEFAV